MNLLVGIAGCSPGWTSIARAEGFPWKEIREPAELHGCSAVIAADPVPAGMEDALREYGISGGALLCSPHAYARLGRVATSSRHVRYLLPQAVGPWARAGFLDLDRRCAVIPGARLLRTDRGEPALYFGEFGAGHVVALPFDAGEVVGDLRTRRRSFPAAARKLPHERVSAVSRTAVGRLVAVALEWLHHQRNLPYVHRWYYPEGAKSVFALRIDTDDGAKSQIRELQAFARDHDVPMSWFVHVMAQASFLGLYTQMQGQEIGVHCFEHRRYGELAAAREDLRRAVDALESAGLHPRGFAAPFGAWSTGLDTLVEEFGFEYSSEFSYDYDGLPSHPLVGGVLRPTLQVPVHPVSIGSLRRQGWTRAEMHAYFERTLSRKLALSEPLVYYHHPRDGHLDVLSDLVRRAREEHVVFMTMADFARWWRVRETQELSVQADGDLLNAGVQGKEIGISMPDGRRAVVPASDRLDLRSVVWQTPVQPVGPDDDMKRARALNPWVAVNAIEDRFTRFFRRSR